MPSPLPTADPIFLILVVSVGVLLALTVAFALLTLRLRVSNERKAARWGRLEEEWEPVILDVLDRTRPPETLQAGVDEEDRLFFLSFLQRYHRRVAGEEREVLRELARPHLPLLRPRIRDRRAEVRARAVQTLAELGHPDHLDAVVAALDDDSPIVQMIAARAIFTKRMDAGYGAVVDRLGAFSLWSRQYLASMLVTGGARAAPLLGSVVRDTTRSTRERAVSLDALRGLRDPSALGLAVEILRAISDRELRVAALRVLEEIGYGDQAELVRSFANSPDDVVRAAAVAALGAVGDRSDLALLTLRMEDPSAWVALEAARALRELGARDILARIGAGEDDEAVLARQVLAEGGL